ncbi:MAG: fluoride exporter [Actinomycetota bacterium]|nr:fluoride exporter [Actinomycetota bacterium]
MITADPDLPPVAVPLIPLLLVVAAGGAVGSLGRYGLARALPHDPSELPLATLTVNVVGCLLLGVLVGGWPRARWLRPFVGTGVLGGFTTFSAFALESDRLATRAAWVFVLYVALSLLLGLAAAALGLRLGSRRAVG